MQTQLYLVRHAHSVYTPDEFNRPLSGKGTADAKTVANIINRENIDYIYSSPYKRAVQTVEKIAEHQNLEIQIVNDLRERKIAGKPVTDFDEAIAKVWEDFQFSWVGGESSFAAQKRGVSAVKKLLEKHAGKNVVIGTHGNIMVLIMNYFNNECGYEFWKQLAMPDIYRLKFEAGTLVTIERCM